MGISSSTLNNSAWFLFALQVAFISVAVIAIVAKIIKKIFK